MQSRDRAAPLRRARRGLAGDRRRHRPRALTPPPARRHCPPTIASPSRVSDAAGHSVCKLHTRNAARAGGRVGYGHRHRLLRVLLPLCFSSASSSAAADAIYIYYVYIHADSTRRRPPSATSIMTPAPQRPLAHAVLPAVVLSRERDRPRYVCLCVCVRVCVCAGAGADGTRGCGGGVGGEAGRRRRRGRGREGTA